jgi:hypothetical protein
MPATCPFRAIVAVLAIMGAFTGDVFVLAEPQRNKLVVVTKEGEKAPRVGSSKPERNLYQSLNAALLELVAGQSDAGDGALQVTYQAPLGNVSAKPGLPPDLAANPCAAMADKPLGTLGIDIAQPPGKLPDDFAAACWNQINEAAGPQADARHWSMSEFRWNATCLCHRPLYFEEVNLERHGYGCCECIQPVVSAAHFFGTVPALPYCMAVDCPCECIYTLGHYRPGSCPPWRCYRPPCDPLAAAAEGGVWTGMIFLIP